MAGNFIRDELAAQLARNVKLVERIEQLGGDRQTLRSVDFFFYASEREGCGGARAGPSRGRFIECASG